VASGRCYVELSSKSTWCSHGGSRLDATEKGKLSIRLSPLWLSCVQYLAGVEWIIMRLGLKFTAIVALLAFVAAPMLSCFVPQHVLNAGENECCRQMGDQCGSKNMPSSHSCCKSSDHNSQPYVKSVENSRWANPIAVTAILPVVAIPTRSVLNAASTTEEFDSPPLSPPAGITVLRI
jgi:hypothetical protein